MRYLFQVTRGLLSIHKSFHLRTERPILHARAVLVVFKTSCQLVFLWISLMVMAPDITKLVALLPYTIFSLFHALTFTRTTIIPHILPPGPPATAGGPPQAHPAAKKLQAWVKCKLISSIKGYSVMTTFRFPSQLRHCNEGCSLH